MQMMSQKKCMLDAAEAIARGDRCNCESSTMQNGEHLDDPHFVVQTPHDGRPCSWLVRKDCWTVSKVAMPALSMEVSRMASMP